MRWPLAIVLGCALAGCVDLGGETRTEMQGWITLGKDVAIPPGALVFFEQGHVQEGTFKLASLIEPDGRFRVEVPRVGSGGPWGIHVYVSPGFFYLPLETQVQEGLLTPVEQDAIAWDVVRMGPSWGASGEQPPERQLLAPIPDDDLSDNPVIDSAEVHRTGPGTYQATMTVHDPNGKLSRQLLVFAPSGEGRMMNPRAPGVVVNDNYPNGPYDATLFVDDAVASGPWYFVAANHGCSNSPILKVTVQ